MATYTSYDLVAFGKPLEARQREMPEPTGTQPVGCAFKRTVLLRHRQWCA